jgi:hypothetical protein
VLGSHARARRHARLWAPAGRPAAEQGVGAREDRGEGAAAHPEDACKAGRGGGRRRAANRAAAELGVCGENGDVGAASVLPGSITSARRKRESRRSSRRARGRSRRPPAPGLGGGHGGSAGARGEEKQRRGRARRKGRGKEDSGRGTYPLIERVGGVHQDRRQRGGGIGRPWRCQAAACLPEEEAKGGLGGLGQVGPLIAARRRRIRERGERAWAGFGQERRKRKRTFLFL